MSHLSMTAIMTSAGMKEKSVSTKMLCSPKISLDSIISQLESLKNMVKGERKNKEVNETLNALKALTPELQQYGISNKDMMCNNRNHDNVLELLTHNIAKGSPNDKSIGHYDAIISVLYSIRTKINK